MGVEYCIPVNSGTAALHMCVAGVGIEPGDEVIIPAFTFWATAAAVLHHNAIPVFVDIDPNTYCIDPNLIEAKITERTRAILPVHIHGMPAEMNRILEIAQRHDLSVIEDVAQAHGALVEGRWERSLWTGVELLNKTIGIVGLGRVGRLVAQRLKGFDVQILAFDPFVSSESARAVNAEMVELDHLLGRSDFVTVHLPKTAETIGLFDSARFAKFKPGARLVNAARGGVVVEDDLVDALESGHLAGAALDVFDTEPKSNSPLFGREDVLVTPHLGASTNEAQDLSLIHI